MTSFKLAPFVVVLVAAFLMFPMKKVEGAYCPTIGASCDEITYCEDGCACQYVEFGEGICLDWNSVKKNVEENPKLCQTHSECKKKGSGNFCARRINSDIKYGFCFASIYEAQDAFKMDTTSKLKMPGTTALN